MPTRGPFKTFFTPGPASGYGSPACSGMSQNNDGNFRGSLKKIISANGTGIVNAFTSRSSAPLRTILFSNRPMPLLLPRPVCLYILNVSLDPIDFRLTENLLNIKKNIGVHHYNFYNVMCDTTRFTIGLLTLKFYASLDPSNRW